MKRNRYLWISLVIVALLHFAVTFKLADLVEYLWRTQPYSMLFNVAGITYGMLCTLMAVSMIYFHTPETEHWPIAVFAVQSILYACLFCIPLYWVRGHRKHTGKKTLNAPSDGIANHRLERMGVPPAGQP